VLAPSAPDARTGPPPTFSILIAAYQAGATIAECVDSALAQTLPAHEVVVVDDGSTDGTAQSLAAYGDRIVYVRQENRGAAAACNAGARTATGEFVSILDADDVYEPERLEALSELAQLRADLDILTTDAYIEVGGKVVGRFYERTPFAAERQRLEIIERCFVTWPALRRRKLLELGGYDESMKIAYDWECYLRLLYSGCRAGAVDEPLMRYRIGGDRSLSDDRLEALRDRVRVLERAERLELSPNERRELDYYLGRRRRRALLAECELALRVRDPAARRLALAVASASGMPAGTRVRAIAAAIAPRAAARRRAALERRSGKTYLRRTAPRAGRPPAS
jgi:glycosyltransferase involved in cell wall biosynthesis